MVWDSRNRAKGRGQNHLTRGEMEMYGDEQRVAFEYDEDIRRMHELAQRTKHELVHRADKKLRRFSWED